MPPPGLSLALLNPNTTALDTDAMVATADALAPPGVRVAGRTAAQGAAVIETRAEEVLAAAEVVRMVSHEPGFDGYLIGCFGDPGLAAARATVRAPVLGIGEAAIQAAAKLPTRFAVVTTLRDAVEETEELLELYGASRRCAGVVCAGVSADAAAWPEDANLARLLEAGRSARDELGAGALVLGCGSMTVARRALADALGMAVCDGVAIGTLTLYALARAGAHAPAVAVA